VADDAAVEHELEVVLLEVVVEGAEDLLIAFVEADRRRNVAVARGLRLVDLVEDAAFADELLVGVEEVLRDLGTA